MALTTKLDWLKEAEGDQDLLWLLRDGGPALSDPEVEGKMPEDFRLCHADPNARRWLVMFRLFLKKEMSEENLDFVQAVDRYRVNQHTLEFAVEIYDDYIKNRSSLNIRDTHREALKDVFEGDVPPTLEVLDGPSGGKDIWYDAYGSCVGDMLFDGYRRFYLAVVPARKDLLDQEKAKATVGAPETPQQAPHSSPEPDEVNAWNEKALRALSRNVPTDFFQIGKLVLVANPGAGAPLPGVGWLQQQTGIVTGTITKKGGVFGSPSLLAVGVQERDTTNFEVAISLVCDTPIEYPRAVDLPTSRGGAPSKASAFGRPKAAKS
jgi:hypothetical protein